ncbi:hypothetical protein EfmAA290_31130 (plasmid) [Enterococcus faecium]|nr:hypothetical protein EfmAA290_31130 [Enterococcus faecium]
MYVSDYFLKAEASKCITDKVFANEFNHVTPKQLDDKSVVILCSHGGNTKIIPATEGMAKKLDIAQGDDVLYIQRILFS